MVTFHFLLIQALCKAANKEGIIVAFNGDGPDEMLSGFSHNEKYLSNNDYFNEADYFIKNVNRIPIESRSKVFSHDFFLKTLDPVEHFKEILNPYEKETPLKKIAIFETSILAPSNNLIKTDRMGASISIEGRSPFLDHRLTEFLSTISTDQLFKNGYGKYFLKKAGLKHFNEDFFLFRKKSMPTLPIGEWIKGPLKDWAYDKISNLDKSIYNINYCRTLLDNHVMNVSNNTNQLRTLISSSIWMNNIINSKI